MQKRGKRSGADTEMATVVQVDTAKQPSLKEDEDMESDAVSASEVDSNSGLSWLKSFFSG